MRVEVLMDPSAGDEVDKVARDWRQPSPQGHADCLAFTAGASSAGIVYRIARVVNEQIGSVEAQYVG